ncbi:hypothetical protein JWG39_01850 [Desulforhopalus vacuolatus]|uniref:hypothetical protein n=1 Tax=Desulforhopalus vacuolatus TaxID=40414 RepID=UPI00196620F4|nr:hypothetical protein [Desulforhopalus vacuolatus]MBM9518558.1 hypothetical protein [Desulforhopalus vacuolatus]
MHDSCALTLGMTVGLRRTFWMFWGELTGVMLVSVCSLAGAATIMLRSPEIFSILKLAGDAWLICPGLQLCRQRGRKLRSFLGKKGGCTLLNRISGVLLAVVGVWLMLS